jgi:hypothetical protein
MCFQLGAHLGPYHSHVRTICRGKEPYGENEHVEPARKFETKNTSGNAYFCIHDGRSIPRQA